LTLQRIGLLAAGILAFAVMILFATMPIAWIKAGRPDESYPELLYIALGMPAGLIAAVAGAAVAKFSPTRSRVALAPLRVTGITAILVCAWLVVVGLGPTDASFDALIGPSLSALFSVGLPVLVVALIVSVRVATKQSKSNLDTGSA
jgi:hypothetical protein